METVGIGYLKAHLSRYVAMAAQGERIIITDRGREVAELVPLSRGRAAVHELVARGRASWGGGHPRGLTGYQVRGRPMSDTVLEDRE